jgi:magnesium chelatase family protein
VPGRTCLCSDGQVHAYRHRLSGPLLDRIDLVLEIPPVTYDQLSLGPTGITTEAAHADVLRARGIQGERGTLNARLTGRALDRACRIGPTAERILKDAMDLMGLSARAHARVLRVSRTIADLAGDKGITAGHLHEALMYRSTLDGPEP